MPVNNTPIAPKDEITGHATLPLSRVKRIIATDDELSTTTCSNTAAFAITIATQHFLTYLVSQTHNVVKAERTPRKTIQYRDVANAVAKSDNLEFLTDVVPRTTTYKAHVARKNNKMLIGAGDYTTRTLEAVTIPISKLPDIGKEDLDDMELDGVDGADGHAEVPEVAVNGHDAGENGLERDEDHDDDTGSAMSVDGEDEQRRGRSGTAEVADD